jgi:hypothetical protein
MSRKLRAFRLSEWCNQGFKSSQMWCNIKCQTTWILKQKVLSTDKTREGSFSQFQFTYCSKHFAPSHNYKWSPLNFLIARHSPTILSYYDTVALSHDSVLLWYSRTFPQFCPIMIQWHFPTVLSYNDTAALSHNSVLIWLQWHFPTIPSYYDTVALSHNSVLLWYSVTFSQFCPIMIQWNFLTILSYYDTVALSHNSVLLWQRRSLPRISPCRP